MTTGIGRPLDAIAPYLDRIAGSVGVTATGAFGIEVTQMQGHYVDLDHVYGALATCRA
jgi:hypothetical protein